MSTVHIEVTAYITLGDKLETVYLPSFDYDYNKSPKEAFPKKEDAKIDALEAIIQLARDGASFHAIDVEEVEMCYESTNGDKRHVIKFR